MNVHDASMAEWPPGDFPRHTVIYACGVVGEAILTRAMRDREVAEVYRAWMHGETTPSGVLNLLTTGIGEGSVTLLARDRPDEFVLRLEHPRFRADCAMGFDVGGGAFRGLLVASFEGEPALAAAFSFELARRVRGTEDAAFSDGPLDAPFHFSKPEYS